MTPTLRQLEIFRTLARARSFTRAADALHMSQSALSQAVAQLETVVGVALFERTKRSVVITPAAQRFLIRIDGVFADLGDALGDLKAECDPRAGRVDLACLSSVAIRILPPAVQEFRKTYPGAIVRVRDDDLAGIVERVKPRGVDFVPIMWDSLRFVCRSGHPLTRRKTIGWSDLAGFDVVALAQGSGIRTLIDRSLPRGDILRNATYEVAKIHSILQIIEQSNCVSVLPALALAYPEAARKFHHRPMIDPEIQRKIGFILPRKVLSATAAAFRDILVESLRRSAQERFPGVNFERTVLAPKTPAGRTLSVSRRVGANPAG